MSMEIGALLSAVSVVLGIAGFFIGRLSASKADGKQDGVILTEIGYLKSGVDDIKRKIEEDDTRYYKLAERVAAVEQSAKQAHKRIDEIGGMHDAERH